MPTQAVPATRAPAAPAAPAGAVAAPARLARPLTGGPGRAAGSRTAVKRATQAMAHLLLAACAALVILPTLALLVYLVYRGAAGLSPAFAFGMPGPGMRSGGIFPALLGTVYLMIGTALASLPVGILAGVFLVEYAPKNWVTRVARLSIANMAGVPSVVYGLFGLAVFVMLMRLGSSLAAASLTLACMTLPVVITATEEALRQVPRGFREASLALGATRWRTTWQVVLPAALPGILTGAVLGIGRAAGETAPILLTGAAFFLPTLPQSASSQFMALPYHLYIIATQVPNIPPDIQWGTALVLVVLVVGVNLAAATYRTRLRRRRSW